jgi:predicted nucleotidyltransferase
MPELTHLHLPERYLQRVHEILQKYLPQAEAWAYGSRVNGDHYEASDLDLVVRDPTDLSHRQNHLSELKEAFSDSDLPIFVQVVDWALIPASFQLEILAGYVVVQMGDSANAERGWV